MIFVFGSNELGIHGRGSAEAAYKHYGARLNQGFGPSEESFAIPTCSKPANGGHEISEDRLRYYVDCFILYAQRNPLSKFKITRIGCGLAGWRDSEVASMFRSAPDNCYFDEAWAIHLPDKRFWGKF